MLPWIWGKATLAMVVSREFITVASIRAMVIGTRLAMSDAEAIWAIGAWALDGPFPSGHRLSPWRTDRRGPRPPAALCRRRYAPAGAGQPSPECPWRSGPAGRRRPIRSPD